MLTSYNAITSSADALSKTHGFISNDLRAVSACNESA